ncbi:MAG: class I SAM-dependent methyltransferase [Thermodesulfobacteriota bacterium]
MNSSAKVFDQSQAVSLAEAKKAFLDKILPVLIKSYEFKTAIDVGCGFGYFTKYLIDLGLEVTAIDARPENLAEASRRNPDAKLEIRNIEDPSIIQSGAYDLTLALGLLYHLENPFLAIRNLAAITRKLCIIETITAPFKTPIAVLVEEGAGQDQGLDYCALIPSESCFVKMLYKSGFRAVYRVSYLPDHRDFRSSVLIKRRRTILIASKLPLEHPLLLLVLEPKYSNQFIHYRFGLSG